MQKSGDWLSTAVTAISSRLRSVQIILNSIVLDSSSKNDNVHDNRG